MGRTATTILILSLILTACIQPTDPEVVQAVAEEPAPEVPDTPETEEPTRETEPEEPQGFRAADATLYILDANEIPYRQETVTDPDRWYARYRSYKLTADQYNQEGVKPGPYPYRFEHGDPPEGYSL